MMQKLMEINDELVRVREERDRLREERDQAVGNVVRLQAQLAEVKSQLEAVVRERYNLQAERNTLDKQLQELIMSQPDFGVERMPKKNKPESQLVKEILSAMDQEEADDAPTEPQFKPYTFAAYIVGDKSQPDALRIVWATEEWIQHAKFGIVHRMRDMQFFGNDGGCNITEYHETLTLSLEVQ